MRNIFNAVLGIIPDSVLLSYWPGISCVVVNSGCLAFTIASKGSDLLVAVNIFCITMGLRMIYNHYAHTKHIAHYHAAFEIAMRMIQPKMNVIFQREHARHGLKEGQMLTQGQLLAIHDEMAELMAEAQEHYKSLVLKSKTDKP